jgi:hypothetical protein
MSTLVAYSNPPGPRYYPRHHPAANYTNRPMLEDWSSGIAGFVPALDWPDVMQSSLSLPAATWQLACGKAPEVVSTARVRAANCVFDHIINMG